MNWRAELYAQKDAQVFLDILEECFNDCDSFDDFLYQIQIHDYLKFSFCQFVLSDFEADFLSEVSYLNGVHEVIDYEKNPANHPADEKPSLAFQQALEAFATSLDERIAYPSRFEQFAFFEVPEWCHARRNLAASF